MERYTSKYEFSYALVDLYIPTCRLCGMEMTVGQEDVKKGQCYVETLAVDASMRGKGVGKMLLDFADNTARARGCHVRN